MDVLQSKQRHSNWRKRYFSGTDRTKEMMIGKPVLVETTLHEDFLENLPNVQEIQPVGGPTIRRYSAVGIPDERYMKELPPLSFQLDEEQPFTARPISEAPTASSIYTRPSPEFPYEFDPEIQVAPLFAGKSKPIDRSVNQTRATPLQQSESASTLKPGFVERARQSGQSPLGIDTSVRGPWQGASGQTNQLTPIAATPATTSVSGSISPIEDPKKANYYPYRPSDEYPSPESPGTPNRAVKPSDPPTITATPDRNVSTSLPPIQETPPGVSRFSWTTHATETEPPHTVAPSTPTTKNSPESWPSSPPVYNQRNRAYQQSPTPAGRLPVRALINRYHAFGSQAQSLPTPESSPPQTQTQTQTQTRANDSSLPRILTQASDTSLPEIHTQAPDSSLPRIRMQAPEPTPPQVQINPPSTSVPQIQTHAPNTVPLSIHARATEPSPTPEVQITTTPPSPIMSRRRPLSNVTNMTSRLPPAASATINKPPQGQQPMKIKRKPTPTIASIAETTGNRAGALSPTSEGGDDTLTGDKQKSLPLTPGTLSSIDHITLLQAELSTLSLRKHNLAKVIASLTALFAPERVASPAEAHCNPMVVDLAARRETKAKVEVLQRELAEVIREEHDVGLRLMRAQRRRDQEVPSALWVRRVTGVSDAVA